GMYLRILEELGADPDAPGDSSLTTLKNRLLSQVRQIEANVDLVIIFDNFKFSWQQALGEDFFNFLHGLRNDRRQLNLSYIFMVNLSLNRSGFYQLNRLFDQGRDRSECWVSLLSQKDALFSIDRQLQRAGQPLDVLSEADKEDVYELSGGHALLNKYLSQLMLRDKAFLQKAKPGEVLAQYDDLRHACLAIWDDLAQNQRNFLIEVVQGTQGVEVKNESMREMLTNYGVLKKDLSLFSPLFTQFVQEQAEPGAVVGISCDRKKTQIVIQTVNREVSFPLNHHPPKQVDLLPLTARSVLCYLLAHQDEVCTRDQLIEALWPSDRGGDVTNRAIDAHVERLRSWLKEHPQLSRYIVIETARAAGYKLVVKD
ncbi:MAG: winged helix-turn-helix domain-containing protein, partial [Chloroflexota bacterium]